MPAKLLLQMPFAPWFSQLFHIALEGRNEVSQVLEKASEFDEI
jgi:hypothetical protein